MRYLHLISALSPTDSDQRVQQWRICSRETKSAFRQQDNILKIFKIYSTLELILAFLHCTSLLSAFGMAAQLISTLKPSMF